MVTCNKSMQLVPTRTRNLRPAEVTNYHEAIRLRVGWVPYSDAELNKTGKNEWVIVRNEGTDKTGFVPLILLDYPDATTDSIWLDMDIDNELLGKLIKHSLITQEPIQRPFAEFFEVAKCSKCHPADIAIDFE